MNVFGILAFVILYNTAALAQNQTEVVLPLTSYSRSSGSSTSFSLDFSRTTMQLDDHHKYTLIIKNADGEPHEIPTTQYCRSLSLIDRLLCFSARWTNQKYVTHSRVKSATISVNGTELTNESNFNTNTTASEISVLNLSSSNTLLITLTGSPSAYIQLSLAAEISPYDEIPPSLMANIFPNTITNQNSIHITVTDLSDTTTDVYNNDVLVLTSQSKDFNVALNEGINNIRITSRDSFNNLSADLLLSNIVLDTVLPVINSNLKIA